VLQIARTGEGKVFAEPTLTTLGNGEVAFSTYGQNGIILLRATATLLKKGELKVMVSLAQLRGPTPTRLAVWLSWDHRSRTIGSGESVQVAIDLADNPGAYLVATVRIIKLGQGKATCKLQ